ncbi:MAG: hypothetical protein K8J31_14735 [Anaerolineae bacterium]|nr:hypothetical protein [Anaerolineae bacterium]
MKGRVVRNQMSCCGLPPEEMQLDAVWWENLWDTLRKRPQVLPPKLRNWSSAQFREIHFRARPRIDLNTTDPEKYAAQCLGWIGLGLWHASRENGATGGLDRQEIVDTIDARPSRVAALLLGGRSDYDQALATCGTPEITFQPSEAQKAFTRVISDQLKISSDPKDLLRKWMDKAQRPLAETSTHLWIPAADPIPEPAPLQTAARVLRASKGLAVPPLLLAGFASAIWGCEYLKANLDPFLAPNLSAVLQPLISWLEFGGTLNFLVLWIGSLWAIPRQVWRQSRTPSQG